MQIDMPQIKNFSLFKERRDALVEQIKARYPKIQKGIVLLFADFEHDRARFRQESSFYYFTGIEEPGVVLALDLSGKTTLFTPVCGVDRSIWMHQDIPLTQENAEQLTLDTITDLGKPCRGYQINPFFHKDEVEQLLAFINKEKTEGATFFALNPTDQSSYISTRSIIAYISQWIPGFAQDMQDISPIVAALRRSKSQAEIERIYRAINITTLAQEAAAQAIADGVPESEIQAGLEYIFIGAGARIAFPSIVASGINGTVLHYVVNRNVVRNGDLVVVDIGAEFDYYCADITRTYPVSGTFTKRQKELYNIVLETQKYIADLAQPGMWLNNKNNPEQSLHHLAKKFIEERGYGNYFVHGVGHYLGMDVHDVGSYATPLKEGDVFTIEPGIYIPQERTGIRIEDDYWMTKDGAICLSEDIPKASEEIEKMVQQQFN